MTQTAPLSQNQIDQVRASLTRCLNRPEFIPGFYRLFLGSSPEIPPMFAHTDMQRQQFMLAASLKTMVLFARTPEGREPDLMRNLAARHDRSQRNIPPHLYGNWLESLIGAVALHDPEYGLELGQAWRAVMQKGVDYMASRY